MCIPSATPHYRTVSPIVIHHLLLPTCKMHRDLTKFRTSQSLTTQVGTATNFHQVSRNHTYPGFILLYSPSLRPKGRSDGARGSRASYPDSSHLNREIYVLIVSDDEFCS